MYNRYIPQPDGSFRRSHIPDQAASNPPHRPEQIRYNREEMNCQNNENEQIPPPENCAKPLRKPQRRFTHTHQSSNYARKQESRSKTPQCDDCNGSFLRQLLPNDLDTGDLLVMALLLLMAGDCQEDKNTALLTLALYLFL